jgi:hypothetical protein
MTRDEGRRAKDGIAALNLFINKKIEYIPSTFDIHDSIFDIRFFYKLRKAEVSFSIKLTAFQASGGAEP